MTVAVVMGVSGSGKTTIAQDVAQRLGWEFGEGDDLHPAANRAKMAAGVALTDEDRTPWLHLVRDWIDARLTSETDAVLTCSALARRYRDVLRTEGVVFVHLAATPDVLRQRLAARRGHFMPVSLLDSQLDLLEVPGADETALVIDAEREPDVAAREITASLRPGPRGRPPKY